MPEGSSASTGRKRALLLHGGWEGHKPQQFADYAATHLLDAFEVVRSEDIGVLSAEGLAGFDLLAPIWTFGELAESQESALLDAVAGGMGMIAWHGAASSFLNSRLHKFLLGGQFVAHPGGVSVNYTVQFANNDPLVSGLEDLSLTSEQYYMLIDPAVKVLATTQIDGGEQNWVAGVEMPVAWTRQWGRGRVFYCSLGHTLTVLEHPTIITLLRRAAKWAARAD